MTVNGPIRIDNYLSGYSKRILIDIINYPNCTNTQRSIRLKIPNPTIHNNIIRLEQLDLLQLKHGKYSIKDDITISNY